MASTTLFAFLDAFETGMETRLVADGLPKVEVYTMPMGNIPRDNIQLIEIDVDTDWSTMGSSRDEDYRVRGVLFHQVPAKSEASAKTARAGIKSIYDSLNGFLRNDVTVGGSVMTAIVSPTSLKQGQDDGRWCALEFTIACHAETRS